MSEYCEVIKKRVEVDSTGRPVDCKYFVDANGKPVCRRVFLGRLGFPNLLNTPKYVFGPILEAFLAFTTASFGKTVLPSWWCKLCTGGHAQSKAIKRVMGVTSLISGDIPDIDDALDLVDEIDSGDD